MFSIRGQPRHAGSIEPELEALTSGLNCCVVPTLRSDTFVVESDMYDMSVSDHYGVK